jgi:urea carboxylase
MVHGASRTEAMLVLQEALAATKLAGIETNLDYLRQVLTDIRLQRGEVSTRFLTNFSYAPQTIDVLVGGTQTTVQDYPGRVGYWDIGVPPSGPMDPLAFRLANRLVGNPPEAAGLECTVLGPTIRFNSPTVICLTGAAMAADLDGSPIPFWTAIPVAVGNILRLGAISGAGYRTYIAIHGGLEIPDYLGSKATFTLGQFGGHCGRTLRVGDVLKLAPASAPASELRLSPELIPDYRETWEIGVLYGPHGAPDFFTDGDIETFFSTSWQVHYNSARTGVRLIGPKPQWARRDGGDAGLHPSNLHDNAYAIGAIDFTGDMPVILGPDGPSLGGFVCPATIVKAELWKIGQLKPGDRVRFQRLTFDIACEMEAQQDDLVAKLQGVLPLVVPSIVEPAILHTIAESAQQVAVVYRQAGDKYVLIEYGPLVLDLNLRFRVHALMTWLQANPILGMLELTPGIRSLQVHYDSRILSRALLLETLIAAEAKLPPIDELEVPTRILHLPLSWEDESTLLAIRKYMQSVRDDAPWCPSNIEFIRRVNGLESIKEVRQILFSASYLVMGLGDVYLGAPVAVPIDPRHRLITTKYNPARTWTPENAVGIGGAYMCIYGMEGPGGYQFVGRTIQVWNRYRQTQDFHAGKPWLLRFFDQIRFYPVSSEELLRLREAFIQGEFTLEVTEEVFSLRAYNQFLGEIAESTATFKAKQQAAFQAERRQWAASGEFDRQEEVPEPSVRNEELALPAGSEAVCAHISANVWQVVVAVGDIVQVGDTLIILESMKMEVTYASPLSGTVTALFCTPGKLVVVGQILAAIAPHPPAS